MDTLHRIASGRARLAVAVVGRGDPVVFLHAGVCDRRMWHAQMAAVGTSHKAIAYDRRGFGETRAEPEDFSSVADLMTVIDAFSKGVPAILVAGSQGGAIALDAALRHRSAFRALVLIAPNVSGSPEAVYPPDVKELMAQQKQAQDAGDLDRLNRVKAHLLLDGPLAPEGRVAGAARQLFLDMNGIVLRSLPVGANLDVAPAYPRLAEIAVPSLVIWGDLEFPHIQDRSRHIAAVMPNGSGHALAGTAHLPSLDRPAEIADLVTAFIDRCK